VYEDGAVWKFYGPAAAVAKCAGEMQLVVDAGKAVKDTSSPNAATTDREERRAKAKEKAKKIMAEGKKEGAAYAAPPASPDSQSSGGEREGSYSEPSESQQLAEDEAAADDVQDSGDTKEEGETGDEEQEAEEKDGECQGQAGPAPLAGESGGGCACSFSSPPVDRAPAKRERKMSDEEQQEAGKRFREKRLFVWPPPRRGDGLLDIRTNKSRYRRASSRSPQARTRGAM
jgi:hypothetical protein